MKNGFSKKLTAVIVVFAVVILGVIVGIDMKSNNTKSVSQTGFAMGSVVSVTVYGTDDGSVINEILDALSKEETDYLSRYKETSEIHRLNESGSLTLSEHTADIIREAVEISRKSDGAFDITVGALSSLWNFDSDTHIIPDENAINSTLANCGWEKIVIDGNRVTLPEGQQLDLGAMGKGIGCDIALGILKNHPEVTGAVVSVGGTVLTYGENPEGKEWSVGIRTPEKDDTSVFMTVKVEGTKFISTSGNYEKCFEKDGVLYHHILSPETGYPVSNSLKSVTVIADSGITADALSTACYVKGLSGSLYLLTQYGADAICIDNDYEVYATRQDYDISYEEYSLIQP